MPTKQKIAFPAVVAWHGTLHSNLGFWRLRVGAARGLGFPVAGDQRSAPALKSPEVHSDKTVHELLERRI